jgi:hypothetical protein
MKRNLLFAVFALLVLVAAAPSYAMCLKCDYGTATCWGSTYANAAQCFSYGTSCITSGMCSNGGDPCEPGTGCGPDVAEAAPLNLEYTLAAVKIEKPAKQTTAIAAATLQTPVAETR